MTRRRAARGIRGQAILKGWGLSAQVTYVKGWGSFKSANEVEVALLEGGSETIPFKNAIIATGSEVTPLPGIEIDEERYDLSVSFSVELARQNVLWHSFA